jgi:hypothetical protein
VSLRRREIQVIILLLSFVDIVVTSFATTTFTTTDSGGQVSVVTSVVRTTARSTPAFKSSASTNQGWLSGQLVVLITMILSVRMLGQHLL